MSYFKELAANWRPLAAATIGLGSGFSAANYVTSIMAPHMSAEFGWSRAEFASVGSLSLLTLVALPIVGRLADVIGVRKTALIGVIAMPLAYLALSMQTGDIRIYVALFLAQAFICITTTATVFSRVVVQYIEKARGLALAIAASGPAVTGVLIAPLLNNFVAEHGWRAGYVAAAAFAAVLGVVALLMLPSEKKVVADPKALSRAGQAKKDYPAIFRNPAFWVMGVALLLCNLPQAIALTQLSVVLIENGATAVQISGMISAFALGTLAGRFVCGVALDRFPAHIVSAIGMALPCVGLFMLASDLDTPLALSAAVLLIGLAFGAEGDLVAYLVVRIFGVRIYSTVLGLMTAIISSSASLGAILLGLTLSATDNFVTYLTITGISVLVGGLMFLWLKAPPMEGAGSVQERDAQTPAT